MKSHDSPALHSQKTQQMSTHTANSAKDDDIKESDHSEPSAEGAAVRVGNTSNYMNLANFCPSETMIHEPSNHSE